MKNLSFVFILCLIMSACFDDVSFKEQKASLNIELELIGIPTKNTGLNSNQCKPICSSRNYRFKAFTPKELESLCTFELDKPFPELSKNPYSESIVQDSSLFCAVIFDEILKTKYRLKNFSKKENIQKQKGIITHTGACGSCSTLQDLKVYAENNDLAQIIKTDNIKNIGGSFESLVDKIKSLGFTKPCAQIWAYNAIHTRNHCFAECITSKYYNNENGDLSKCIKCDEDKSGATFKSIAGRTRRNSGIPNSICRKCSEISPLGHNYPLN